MEEDGPGAARPVLRASCWNERMSGRTAVCQTQQSRSPGHQEKEEKKRRRPVGGEGECLRCGVEGEKKGEQTGCARLFRWADGEEEEMEAWMKRTEPSGQTDGDAQTPDRPSRRASRRDLGLFSIFFPSSYRFEAWTGDPGLSACSFQSPCTRHTRPACETGAARRVGMLL